MKEGNATTGRGAIDRFEDVVVGSVSRQPLRLVRGQGATVWDDKGTSYLDFFVGRGTSNLGHCHPAVVQAIQAQAESLVHIGNDFYSKPQGELAEAIIEASFEGKVFFSNSGAEANEAALKLARRYAALSGCRNGTLVAVERGFHGRTLGALSVTWEKAYREDFEPLIGTVEHIPLNDISAARRTLRGGVAAMILELVQGESGVYVADPEWVSEIRSLCSEHDIVLIFDEVQTGIGRCGSSFAYQRYGIEPDVMTLAKSLAGGVPIGATVINRRFEAVLTPGTHSSTFGGGPLACRAGIAVMAELRAGDLLERGRIAAQRLEERLTELARKHARQVVETRGLGLMRAIELRAPIAQEVMTACRERHGLLVTTSGPSIIRLLPPIVVSADEIDRACAALEDEIALGG